MKDRGREEQRGHQRHANRPASLKDVWADYLKDGYFERVGDEDCLRVEYVSYDRMNRLAAEMASQGLTKTQLRRFFSHCRAIEIKLKGGASWESVRPLFLKLRYVAAHSSTQASKEFPRLFYEFISLNVDSVKTKKDFMNGFMPHFEALVGFAALHQKK